MGSGQNIKFKIPNWDLNFENDRSRTRDHCRFVCVPNKQHGMGLTYILSLDDGDSVYGIWNLILGACSQQPKPREGWLTDDGTEHGRAWTIDDMSMRWRRPKAIIERALQVLCCEYVRWLITVESPPSNHELTRKGREGNGKERREELAAQASAEPQAASTVTVADDPVIFCFPCKEPNKSWDLRQSKISQWQCTYPHLDVPDQCRRALQWVIDRPDRRKTARGMTGFLGGWMGRTQDRKEETKNAKRNSGEYVGDLGLGLKPIPDKAPGSAAKVSGQLAEAKT